MNDTPVATPNAPSAPTPAPKAAPSAAPTPVSGDQCVQCHPGNYSGTNCDFFVVYDIIVSIRMDSLQFGDKSPILAL